MSPAWANLTKRMAYYTGWAGQLPSFLGTPLEEVEQAHFFWIRKRWRRISGCTAKTMI
jgi:hypothetical protein